MKEEEKEGEETHVDRRMKYRKLVAGGMSDKEAAESVWPTTTAGLLKNAREKADKAKRGEDAGQA